jgi:TonB family protein
MRRRLELGKLGLGLALLSSIFIIPMRHTSAQEASADAGHRKVKNRVTPEYPLLAKQMSVTGKVKVETTIAPDGHVTNTKVVGGSPILVSAAIDALRKWRFESAPKESTEVIEFEFRGQN